MSVQLDRLEEHLQLGRTTRATQNRPVQLQFASGLVDNDRKYAGNTPEGVALPGNSGLLGAVEGAQREDFPKILPTERPADQKDQGGGKMLDVGRCPPSSSDNIFGRLIIQ
jgi:hypothetical protein